MTEAATEVWEYIGEFARAPRRLGDPPRYRIYRNSNRTKAAILRIWPDPEAGKTVVATRNEAGELQFGGFPADPVEGGQNVPWSERDKETAERAIRLVIGDRLASVSTGGARA